MKLIRFAAAAMIMALSICSCSEKSEVPASSIDKDSEISVTSASMTTVEKTSVSLTAAGKTSAETTAESAETVISGITVSGTSGSTDNMRRYTPDDLYMECINVGYVSGMPSKLMIKDRQQLEYAKTRYPLYIPEDADENERRLIENLLIEPFNIMTEKYPVEEYTYLLEYISSSGGGNVKAGELVIDSDRIYFLPSEDSRFPDDNGMIPDVCSDYCYIAAVPKEYLSSNVYTGWIFPDENNIYQDKDFKLSFAVYDTSNIYDIYGDTHYLIRSREEYDNFLVKSSHIRNVSGNPFVYDMKPDFDKTAFAAYFYTSPEIKYPNVTETENKINISGNDLDISLDLSGEQGSGTCTFMIYAFIPNRFLTEQKYNGWEAPSLSVPQADTIPAIDRSKYGNDAIILTAEDVFIYGSHSSIRKFSGKYIMHGEKGISTVSDDIGLNKDKQFRQFIDMKRYNLDFERYRDSFNNILFVQYIEKCDKRLRPYALVISGNKAEFLYTESGDISGTDESCCFFAAVPEQLLDNIRFEGWSVYDEKTVFSEPPAEPGEMYYKEPSADDIVIDQKTGIKYVKDQLLVSAFTDSDKNEIENIIHEAGAEIVGYIELTNDYQIEFTHDMSIDDLQSIADHLNSYPFISNVTLNVVTDTIPQ